MANLNRVLLIGNLTRDPEVRYTPSKGTAVCDIGLAINRVIATDDGRKEETVFVDVTVWGRTAEVAGQYLTKGRPVFIEGRLQTETWEKDGQKRSRLKVVCENLQLLSRPESGERPAAPRPAARPQAREPEPDINVEPNDIPF
jgi:single-strand DNA-binding protein